MRGRGGCPTLVVAAVCHIQCLIDEDALFLLQSANGHFWSLVPTHAWNELPSDICSAPSLSQDFAVSSLMPGPTLVIWITRAGGTGPVGPAMAGPTSIIWYFTGVVREIMLIIQAMLTGAAEHGGLGLSPTCKNEGLISKILADEKWK